MGILYKAQCAECGHSFECSRGCGMFDCTEIGREQHKEKILSGAFGTALKAVLEEHPDATVSYAKELFYCEDCNEYQNLARYKIYDKASWEASTVLAVSQYTCKSCHKLLRVIGDSFIPHRLPCPRCKALARVEVTLLYD